MPDPNIDPVVAERSYTYYDPVTGPRQVSVRLGAPRTETGCDWRCPWQIVGVGSETIMSAVGIDAFHSLQLVMVMIGATLQAQVQGNGVRLSWLDDDSADLGFPDELQLPAER